MNTIGRAETEDRFSEVRFLMTSIGKLLQKTTKENNAYISFN